MKAIVGQQRQLKRKLSKQIVPEFSFVMEQPEEKKPDPAGLDRCIYLTGPVGEEVSKETICLLLEYQRQDPMREVTIILDSYGGEVDSMYAITDVMELVITPIRTICIGKAMSAAAFIFLSGAKGRRFMTRHSRLMFHQMSTSHWGPVSDILISTNEIRFLQEQMIEDISKRSKLKTDAVRALIDRESYIRPEEAIKMGICDKIIDRLS